MMLKTGFAKKRKDRTREQMKLDIIHALNNHGELSMSRLLNYANLCVNARNIDKLNQMEKEGLITSHYEKYITFYCLRQVIEVTN